MRTKIALDRSDIKICTSRQIDLTQTCIFSRGIRLFAVFDCILTTTDRKVLKTKNIPPFKCMKVETETFLAASKLRNLYSF